jgi:hypothetical protein
MPCTVALDGGGNATGVAVSDVPITSPQIFIQGYNTDTPGLVSGVISVYVTAGTVFWEVSMSVSLLFGTSVNYTIYYYKTV